MTVPALSGAGQNSAYRLSRWHFRAPLGIPTAFAPNGCNESTDSAFARCFPPPVPLSTQLEQPGPTPNTWLVRRVHLTQTGRRRGGYSSELRGVSPSRAGRCPGRCTSRRSAAPIRRRPVGLLCADPGTCRPRRTPAAHAASRQSSRIEKCSDAVARPPSIADERRMQRRAAA